MRWALPLVSLLLAGCVATPAGPAGDGDGGTGPRYALACSGLAKGNASWTEPCLAFASPNDSPSKTEIDLAVHPLDPSHVVVASKDLDTTASPCVWSIAQVSKDAGATWITSYVGGQLASRKPGDPLYGWRCITDPILAFDAKGTLYYSLQASRQEAFEPVRGVLPQNAPLPAGGNMYMARSRDGGLTWEKIILLLPGDGATVFHDYMRMGVNPKTGSIYTTWNQFTGTRTVQPLIVASRDGGDSAAPPAYPVAQVFPQGAQQSGLAIGADGRAWLLIEGPMDTLYVTRSDDDARTWSAPVKVGAIEPIPRMMRNNTFRTGPYMDLAIDTTAGPRAGWLYATYGDHVDDDANVRLQVSSDGGATWSEPILVSAGEHARGDQWMARPFVDRLGTLHVVYLSREFDEQNYGTDAVWAYSTDAGATWTHTRLTATSFDASLGIHQFGGPFIGDYLGIGGAGDNLYLAFPTTVTGRAEIAVARVTVTEAPS